MRRAIPEPQNLRFATLSCEWHTDSCERVHPPKRKCASHYGAVHSQMWECAFRYSGVRKNVWIYRTSPDPLRAMKNVRFTTVLGDRHHVFTERVARRQMKFAFRYSFERSTARFKREGCREQNEICVSLQFWAIDTTFLTRGLPRAKWNLRFATVFGDRQHVFSERVARRQNEICVSLQFWAIDNAFLAKGLTTSKWNLRFATVLGDRRRVFSERVDFRLTLPIPPGGIE